MLRLSANFWLFDLRWEGFGVKAADNSLVGQGEKDLAQVWLAYQVVPLQVENLEDHPVKALLPSSQVLVC